MPNLDGFEICKILKETDEDSIEKAYDIGGSDYITKPFKPKELIARVSRYTKKSTEKK